MRFRELIIRNVPKGIKESTKICDITGELSSNVVLPHL
jgi:hypothetical protein